MPWNEPATITYNAAYGTSSQKHPIWKKRSIQAWLSTMVHAPDITKGWTRTFEMMTDCNKLAKTTVAGVTETYFSTTPTAIDHYDERGNITGGMIHLNGADTSMYYNEMNRLERVVLNGTITEYYQYDGAGQRLRKTTYNTSGAILKERKYVGDYELYEESGGVADFKKESYHVMDDTARIELIETELDPTDDSVIQQVCRYQFSDHLSTATLELDENADVITCEEYYPFGNTSFQTHASGISQKRYRFTGKERDDLTGFYYHGARYYACWLVRWCACDPINDDYYNAVKGNLQKNAKRDFLELAASTYEYCYDSPIVFTDTDGEQPQQRHFLNKPGVTTVFSNSLYPSTKTLDDNVKQSFNTRTSSKELPKIIGTTYGDRTEVSTNQLKSLLDSGQIEKRTGFTAESIIKLTGAEGLSLRMYDVDQQKERMGTVAGHGGNATIGFGHLIHFGAIGSDQYDKNAITNEAPFRNGVTLQQAVDLLIQDVAKAVAGVDRKSDKIGVEVKDLNVKLVLTDYEYNSPGSTSNAIKEIKEGGVSLLYNKIENGQLPSISAERKEHRLNLLKNAVSNENKTSR